MPSPAWAVRVQVLGCALAVGVLRLSLRPYVRVTIMEGVQVTFAVDNLDGITLFSVSK